MKLPTLGSALTSAGNCRIVVDADQLRASRRARRRSRSPTASATRSACLGRLGAVRRCDRADRSRAARPGGRATRRIGCRVPHPDAIVALCRSRPQRSRPRRPLSGHRADRRRCDGRGLSRRAAEARARGRDQDHARRAARRARQPPALRARGQADGAPRAPALRVGDRLRRPRRQAVPRDGSRARHEPASSCSTSEKRLEIRRARARSCGRCCRASRTRTSSASFIATSSPRTSWSPRRPGSASRCGSSTSGSRARRPSATKLTTGIVVGTPNYMAPEQMPGRRHRRRAPISTRAA